MAKKKIDQSISATCKDCGKDFVITPEEQRYFKSIGFELPKRCTDCRKARKDAKKAAEAKENARLEAIEKEKREKKWEEEEKEIHQGRLLL